MLGLGQPEGHAALSPGGPRPPLLVQAESVGVGQELAPLRGALHGVRKRGHRPYPEKSQASTGLELRDMPGSSS